MFAIVDIVLLLLDRIYLLHLELLCLVLEAIVVRVVFLFYCLWLQNI